MKRKMIAIMLAAITYYNQMVINHEEMSQICIYWNFVRDVIYSLESVGITPILHEEINRGVYAVSIGSLFYVYDYIDHKFIK